MNQTYQLLQKQKQILSQQQVQSLNILAMDNIELDLFLQSEYLENPMLEQAEYSRENCADGNKSRMENEKDKWNKEIEEPEDLKTHLRLQLQIHHENIEKTRVKQFMIECVNEDGYFTMPLYDVAKECNVSLEFVQECLGELKQLEPTGVFSENLQEYLILQIKEADLATPELLKMIEEHLEHVAAGNIGAISRELHISTAQVRKYISIISTLSPRPASGFGENKTEYIIPDIIVRKEGEWEIEINDAWIGDYRLSDYYVKMMRETKDPELKEYFEQKMMKVRLILSNIEQRRKTMIDMMKIILELQKDFFEGKSGLKPMTMSEVAECMGIHVSTVSRAVKGKYLQYPRGILPIRKLFTKKVLKESHEDLGAEGIRQKIADLIERENKEKPYSDQAIKELLEQEGVCVSRRVVAKYRDELGIKGSFLRKTAE